MANSSHLSINLSTSFPPSRNKIAGPAQSLARNLPPPRVLLLHPNQTLALLSQWTLRCSFSLGNAAHRQSTLQMASRRLLLRLEGILDLGVRRTGLQSQSYP